MMKRMKQVVIEISRFLFILLIVGSAFSFAMFQGGIVSWTIFYAILPFALYSFLLFFYPLSNMTVKRQMDTTFLQVGDSLKVKIILKRRIPFPLVYTVIHDDWIGDGLWKSVQTRQKLFVFGWKRKLTWVYELEQLTRGEHRAEKIQVEVFDFFGWIRKRKVFSVVNRLLIYPKIETIDYVPLKVPSRGKLVAAPFNFLKDRSLVTGVREYGEGDRMSQIHWKSFARTDTLMTKEFEDEGSGNLYVVMDHRLSVVFEAQVSFAASLLRELQKASLQVQFVTFDRTKVFKSIQSDEQFTALFTYLAKIQPVKDKEMKTFSALEETLSKSGTTAIITHRIDSDLLQLLSKSTGPNPIVCFVVIEGESLITHEIRRELKIARAQGITVKLIEKIPTTDAFKEVVLK